MDFLGVIHIYVMYPNLHQACSPVPHIHLQHVVTIQLWILLE